MREPGVSPVVCLERTGEETVQEDAAGGSEESEKNVKIDDVETQMDALLDEDMVSDDDIKISQKRKGTESGNSSSKLSRRAVTLSQEGDSDLALSQESPAHSLYTGGAGGGIKRFLERTKGQRLIIVEDHFPHLKVFLKSAKLLTRKCGRVDDELSDQEVYSLKKHIVKVKSQLSSQNEEV